MDDHRDGDVSPGENLFLSRAQIESVVASGSDRVRACYERLLWTAEGDESHSVYMAPARLVMNWVIGLDGNVTDVSILEDSDAPPLLSACVVHAVSEMVFDPPDGGLVVVTYPFTFRTEDAQVPDAR